MASRGLQGSDVHRIQLPGTFHVQLSYPSQVALYQGYVPEDNAEDLAVSFPKATIRGDPLEELIPRNKFFVRLDTCSLKDSIIGEGPVKNTRDLWMRLASSAHGMAGIRDLRKQELSTPIVMYLFPWQDNMRTELKYRVYCPPPTGKIAAIFQYKWHARWFYADAKEKYAGLVHKRNALHDKIMAHLAMTELLKSRGFVFDVVENPDTQEVKLIELNDFGAMSGCGPCLFHWIRNARVMYGVDEGVKVRVAALLERLSTPGQVSEIVLTTSTSTSFSGHIPIYACFSLHPNLLVAHGLWLPGLRIAIKASYHVC